MTEHDLYHAALAKPEAERRSFLHAACAGRPELRAAVEKLLAAHADSGSFLKSPPPELSQTVDSDPGPIKEEATGEFTPNPAAERAVLGVKTDHCPQAEPGSVIAGRYTLVEPIGEGGMGEVWVARQSEPVKRKVALKLIKAGMDSKSVVQRFEQERQALAMMDHPNIARIYDGGATPTGQPFFVMELVQGAPITRFCDERRLGLAARLELFVAACQAVQHAHQKGIIHRDLKPGNVLVTEIDGRPTPKVIDFGVAKATEQKLTDASLDDVGLIVGTPTYMSPEQADPSASDIDTRTDVYALGVILYELLVGSPPFDAKQFKRGAILEMLRMVREDEPPRPSTKLSSSEALPNIAANRAIEPAKLADSLRGELDWVVMKSIEKDRTRRYETANALSRDIQRYLADEVVEARPPSRGYRLKKLVKRHKVQVIAAGLVALSLVAGILGTTWGMLKAEERSVEAESARDAEAIAKRDADDKRRLAEQAAAAEKAAKEQTLKRLAQIEKGVELFAGLLDGINPRLEETGGDSLYVQLRKRAEKAADELNAEAVGDALAVARLQNILGNTLRELGGYTKAIEVLGKSRAIRERELESDHPETLDTLDNLALVYLEAGRLPEAVHFFELVRDGRIRKQGADHLDTLNTLNSLANAYRAAGKSQEAIALFERVRDARVRSLGADHRSTLITLNGLAMAYEKSGKLSEAIAIFERVRDARVRVLGADHLSTFVSLNNLASAYRSSGRLPEAIAIFERVRDGLVTKLGSDHPSTIQALNNLATAYQEAGKLPEAIAPSEQAAAGLARRRFQHVHADQIILSTIAICEQAGRLDKAEGWRRQWLAVVRQQAGADSPAYADQLAALALNLVQQKKWADAEPILRECLPIREKKLPDAWNTFNTMSQLGGALLGQKKYVDVEPLLLKGYEGMKARDKFIPPQASTRLSEALDRLIELYTATNKPGEVKKWKAERAKYPAAKAPEKK